MENCEYEHPRRCTNKAYFVCKCLESEHFFCSIHIKVHIDFPAPSHNTMINPRLTENKELITKKSLEHIEQLNVFQQDLEQDKEALIKKIEEIYEKGIEELNKRKQQLIDFIRVEDDTILDKNKDYLNSLVHLRKENVIRELNTWTLPQKNNHYQAFLDQKNIDIIVDGNSAPYYKEPSCLLSAFIVQNQESPIRIMEYNFEEFRQDYEISKMKARYIFSCQLSEDLIFCGFGSSPKTQIPTVNNYLIYNKLKNDHIRLKKIKGDCRYLCASIYLNNKVFVFGGGSIQREQINYETWNLEEAVKSQGVWLDSILRFNLETNETEKLLVKMPCGSETTGCVINSDMFITGYSMNRVYNFYPYQQFFQDSGLQVHDEYRKVLIPFKNQLFLVCGDEISKRSLKNRGNWKLILSTSLLTDGHVHNYAVHNNSIYMTNGYQIWSFNVVTRNFKVIRNVYESVKFECGNVKDCPPECVKKPKLNES
jgi:hypothetical protein